MMNKKLLKQAQDMMAKIERVKEETARKTVESTVGGGMVTAVARGDNTLVEIRVEREAVDPDDIEMLQDLIVAAVNDALKKAQQMMSDEMGKLTAGLNIPGLM